MKTGDRQLNPFRPFDLRGWRGGIMITTNKTLTNSHMPRTMKSVCILGHSVLISDIDEVLF
ncbi:hypothetical protein JJB99_31005 [Bradyrhizobium diazoefficiens]|uniref:hypothetical protein n=1 Tax=Bradyrhizobium diazoefficiens TaxID=1355477 RepID=UPI00190D1400|nr:hypothetical protein [Bradyrhizobium diazoefficiens]QQO13769.1 hypothetical protein JJB99_31005 [Bradyrhizobium diazoefficiens]